MTHTAWATQRGTLHGRVALWPTVVQIARAPSGDASEEVITAIVNSKLKNPSPMRLPRACVRGAGWKRWQRLCHQARTLTSCTDTGRVQDASSKGKGWGEHGRLGYPCLGMSGCRKSVFHGLSTVKAGICPLSSSFSPHQGSGRTVTGRLLPAHLTDYSSYISELNGTLFPTEAQKQSFLVGNPCDWHFACGAD